MKKIEVGAVALMFCAAIIWGVAPAALRAEDRKMRVALSLPDLSYPYFVNMDRQARDEAAKLGMELQTFDGKNSVPKQTADLEAAIVRKFDGILVVAIAPEALQPALEQINEAGIAVATVDRDVRDAKVLVHVVSDNVAGGRQQAELLGALLPNGGKVFELRGTVGLTPSILRHDGFRQGLAALPNVAAYQIVLDQVANYRRDQALKVVESALAKHPDVGAIVTANDDMALGALEALKGSGLAGKVHVISFDGQPEALSAVRDGMFAGTVDQYPARQVRLALQRLAKFLGNKETPPAPIEYVLPLMITAKSLSDAERISEARPQ